MIDYNSNTSQALLAFNESVETESLVPFDDSGQTKDESVAVPLLLINQEEAHDEQPCHEETTKLDEVEIVEKSTGEPDETFDHNRQTEEENIQIVDEELNKQDEPNDKKNCHEETPDVHEVKTVDDTNLMCSEVLSPNLEDTEIDNDENLDETLSIENDSPQKCNPNSKCPCYNPLHDICRICSRRFLNLKRWDNRKTNIGKIIREIQKYKGTNILMDPSWYPIFAHKNTCFKKVQKGLCIRETLPGFTHPGNVSCQDYKHLLKKPIPARPRADKVKRYDLLNLKMLIGKNRQIERNRPHLLQIEEEIDQFCSQHDEVSMELLFYLLHRNLSVQNMKSKFKDLFKLYKGTNICMLTPEESFANRIFANR